MQRPRPRIRQHSARGASRRRMARLALRHHRQHHQRMEPVSHRLLREDWQASSGHGFNFSNNQDRWARIKARLHQPAAQNSSNGLKCHLRHASRAIHDIHVEGEMGGGHAKVVLGSPLHSIAMHGAVYRRWQGDLSIYRDGGGGGPAKPTCGVVASSVVDERVSNNGCCGGEGDFGRCDGTGRPGKLTSAFVQMKPRAKLRRRRREGHRALRAELEDNRVLGHRGVEAAARCAVSGNCKSEGARGSIWKLPIEAWQC